MIEPQNLVQDHLSRNNWGILGTQGYILGIDLGGYGLRVALVDLQNRTYVSTSAETENNDHQAILDKTTQLVQKLLQDVGGANNRLVRIVIGFGGPVDPNQGVVLVSPRVKGLENFSLKNHFEEMFDTVTLVDNDANLIALGEATFGVGQGSQDLFYMHLSSGVGGGIVLDGRIYHGAAAMAGEIGHAVVELDGSNNASESTLEELVSINGLLKQAQELGLSTNNLNDIFSDNPVGQKVVNETVNVIAMRLANVIALLDPQMIVLGGIVVRIGGNDFVTAIAQKVNQYLAPALARPVKIEASVLGTDSIAVGALALALESLCD